MILKLGVFAEKGQTHSTRGTITVFANDDFGAAFILGFFVVVLLAVHHHDDIGVLFDGAGFA